MRIIAGERKGHPLRAPRGSGTRPTLSRARESVFSILGAQVLGATAADLFAGAGSLGLEALSRGAHHCIFVERNRAALDTLHANIRKLGYESKTVVCANDVLRWLRQPGIPPYSLTLILADPPYQTGLAEKTMSALAHADLLQPDGMLVMQCAARETIPEECAPLGLYRTELYGETAVHFFCVMP
ncbi:MAG: 16S rRNA (guanine(966)-N(2))-methyltransferase RsmD [bacterium]|nr:16S rRNA (guanine(966)-N(2))-methyltransferase RsmD [Candidatus Sumerlaeota bacterium]